MVSKEDWVDLQRAYEVRRKKEKEIQGVRRTRRMIRSIFKSGIDKEQTAGTEYATNYKDSLKGDIIRADKMIGEGRYSAAIGDLQTTAWNLYLRERKGDITSVKAKELYDAIETRLLRIGKKNIGSSNYEKVMDSVEEVRGQVEKYARGENGLEGKAMAILFGAGLLASLFFFSFNFTGNAVSNLSMSDGNILGIVFFLVGLIGAFFYSRRKR